MKKEKNQSIKPQQSQQAPQQPNIAEIMSDPDKMFNFFPLTLEGSRLDLGKKKR